LRTSPKPPDDHARPADRVAKILADWPPLTDAQLDRIAALLRAGGAA
jgi:hypothetical protein